SAVPAVGQRRRTRATAARNRPATLGGNEYVTARYSARSTAVVRRHHVSVAERATCRRRQSPHGSRPGHGPARAELDPGHSVAVLQPGPRLADHAADLVRGL